MEDKKLYSLYKVQLTNDKQFEFKYIGDKSENIDDLKSQIMQSIEEGFEEIKQQLLIQKENNIDFKGGVIVMPFIYIGE